MGLFSGDPNKQANLDRWHAYVDDTESRNNGGDYVDQTSGEVVDRGGVASAPADVLGKTAAGAAGILNAINGTYKLTWRGWERVE